MHDNLIEQSLPSLHKAIADGTIRCAALVDEAIARNGRHGAALGAYRHWASDRSRKQASAVDGLLAAGRKADGLTGIPVSIKDIFGVRDMPVFAGMSKELDRRWQAEGPVVDTVARENAIIMGKTHSAELAFSGVGTCAHWPAPRNPWDAVNYRLCGGSSVGAGVSLMEGSALLALGTDTGGSVRIPASACGVVGLKTTCGRWSTAGIVPLSTNFDAPGPLTRTVEDAAFVFAALDPRMREDRRTYSALAQMDLSGLRIAVCDDYFWEECEPGVAEGVQAAIRELEKNGASIRTIKLPEARAAAAFYASIVPVEGLAFLLEHHSDRIDLLDPNIRARMLLAHDVSGTKYFSSLSQVRQLGRSAAERLRHVDVLVTPTTPLTPPILQDVADENGYRAYNLRVARNTQPISMLALCALTMPVALDAKRMPVGMQLVALGGEEERLLAAGLACERALGTARQRLGVPPLLAN